MSNKCGRRRTYVIETRFDAPKPTNCLASALATQPCLTAKSIEMGGRFGAPTRNVRKCSANQLYTAQHGGEGVLSTALISLAFSARTTPNLPVLATVRFAVRRP
jgi:hypothetical protein